MRTSPNIVLVGFMGTGKTTVGRLLADRQGMTFTDMDEVIEREQGKPISRIFAEHGEPFFRALERQLAERLGNRTGLVIATGGGIVLNPANIAHLGRNGRVIALTATPEAILARVAHETHRPLLAGGDAAAKIAALLTARAPLYGAIPLRVDTVGRSPAEVADAVLALCGGPAASTPASGRAGSA